MSITVFRLLCVFLFFSFLLAADPSSLTGEVYVENTAQAKTMDQWSVEVRLMTNRINVERTTLAADGSFSFRNLEPGNYEIAVVNLQGRVIKQEVHYVGEFNSRLHIDIPNKQQAGPGGTISVGRLKHKTPKAVQKLLLAADKAARKGDQPEAIRLLRQAVALDPDSFEGHNNLGVRYFATSEYDKAYEEFQQSGRIDPNSPEVKANLGAALLGMHKPIEAEARIRESVQLGGTNTRTQYLLGVAMYQQGRYTNEARALLEEAAQRIPRARITLADMLARLGKTVEAKNQLKQYLDSGSNEQRAAIEKWYKTLR
jgi:tetratricopeptide (TPR) repeat protein